MTDGQSVKEMVNDMMARVVKNPNERRSELIAAAQHLFYTKGYERTSVNDIVKEVGVAKGTFYYYFDSKTAVLEAMILGMAAHIQAIFGEIVDNETLDAIAKWNLSLQATGNWKLERKEEILELIRMQTRPENVLLQYKLRQELFSVTVAEYVKIIAQGVTEGVFNTLYVEESAGIVLSILTGHQESMMNIFLNPEQLENPASYVLHKYKAIQTAIERVLGAAEGSLPIVDEPLITAWFAG